ncbi:hypothetical protein BDZ89DRAFT_395082 [Hymenopellis radicata]|nr:hypothetical protein BDZ89DRAFT_395082 [Hymenopellis radicata]
MQKGRQVFLLLRSYIAVMYPVAMVEALQRGDPVPSRLNLFSSDLILYDVPQVTKFSPDKVSMNLPMLRDVDIKD